MQSSQAGSSRPRSSRGAGPWPSATRSSKCATPSGTGPSPVTTSRGERSPTTLAIRVNCRRSTTSTSGSQSASSAASSAWVPRGLNGTPTAAARTVASSPSTSSTPSSRQNATLAPRSTPREPANCRVRSSSSAQLTARRSSAKASFPPCREAFPTSNSTTGRTADSPPTRIGPPSGSPTPHRIPPAHPPPHRKWAPSRRSWRNQPPNPVKGPPCQSSSAVNRSEMLLMQYRWSVGVGYPSPSKTCPRCEPQRAQRTSVRTIPCERSSISSTASLSFGS